MRAAWVLAGILALGALGAAHGLYTDKDAVVLITGDEWEARVNPCLKVSTDESSGVASSVTRMAYACESTLGEIFYHDNTPPDLHIFNDRSSMFFRSVDDAILSCGEAPRAKKPLTPVHGSSPGERASDSGLAPVSRRRR